MILRTVHLDSWRTTRHLSVLAAAYSPADYYCSWCSSSQSSWGPKIAAMIPQDSHEDHHGFTKPWLTDIHFPWISGFLGNLHDKSPWIFCGTTGTTRKTRPPGVNLPDLPSASPELLDIQFAGAVGVEGHLVTLIIGILKDIQLSTCDEGYK